VVQGGVRQAVAQASRPIGAVPHRLESLMLRQLKNHALQILAAAGMLYGAWWAHQRWIFVDNFGTVAEGVLYRCPQPKGGQWRLLERYHIASVVNLRAADQSPDELNAEKRACSRAGAIFVHIPVIELVPTDTQVRAFLSAVRKRRGPVLVHCEHGEDRAGMMVAAWRVKVQGWPIAKALREMERFRGRIDGPKRRRVERLLRDIQVEQWLRRETLAPGRRAARGSFACAVRRFASTTWTRPLSWADAGSTSPARPSVSQPAHVLAVSHITGATSRRDAIPHLPQTGKCFARSRLVASSSSR